LRVYGAVVTLLLAIYALALLGMALYGLNMLLMTALSVGLRLADRRRPPPAPAAGPNRAWPTVLVQLPLYNERYVAERLIDAVAALDYPRDRLAIQVLDDSTDDTAARARARAAQHRARGLNIEYRRRPRRTGYKAGALAAGLRAARADYVAIFDADFVPQPDFLRRALPVFEGQSRLALVQARWEHLNHDLSTLTQAEGLALDAYEDAGGWQADTLSEDLDLSFRAQMRGWRLTYSPSLAAPAELPTTLAAFKRQQSRWSQGAFQVLRKLGPRLLRARLPWWLRLQGLFSISGYLPHPLIIVTLLLTLPVVLLGGQLPPAWGVLGLAGLGPMAMSVAGQLALRRDWPRRLIHLPALILIGLGLAVANTQAAWRAFFGGPAEFQRTPKTFGARAARGYAIPLDWTTWAEAGLAGYALLTGLLALERVPALAPMAFIYALGFGYTAALGFWQSRPALGWGARRPQGKDRRPRRPAARRAPSDEEQRSAADEVRV
jgi:hypothetical protein